MGFGATLAQYYLAQRRTNKTICGKIPQRLSICLMVATNHHGLHVHTGVTPTIIKRATKTLPSIDGKRTTGSPNPALAENTRRRAVYRRQSNRSNHCRTSDWLLNSLTKKSTATMSAAYSSVGGEGDSSS
jgi:hypothetical protein